MQSWPSFNFFFLKYFRAYLLRYKDAFWEYYADLVGKPTFLHLLDAYYKKLIIRYAYS